MDIRLVLNVYYYANTNNIYRKLVMNRDSQNQLDKIEEILNNIKCVDMIGVNGLDIYLEPSGYPQLAAELALAIKPILVKHRNKIKASATTTKLGF